MSDNQYGFSIRSQNVTEKTYKTSGTFQKLWSVKVIVILIVIRPPGTLSESVAKRLE